VAKLGTSKTVGLHNKPTGCGASGAYAPGPDEEEMSNWQTCEVVSNGVPFTSGS